MTDIPLTSVESPPFPDKSIDDYADGNPQSVIPQHLPRLLPPPPLAMAVLQDSLPRVRQLLAADPTSVLAQTYLGLSVLRLVCQTCNLQIMSLLITAGAQVNEYDNLGHTPLHAAVIEHWLDGARLLIHHGASINAMPPLNRSVKGVLRETPLHHAVRTADEPITLLMLGKERRAPNAFAASGAMEEGNSNVFFPSENVNDTRSNLFEAREKVNSTSAVIKTGKHNQYNTAKNNSPASARTLQESVTSVKETEPHNLSINAVVNSTTSEQDGKTNEGSSAIDVALPRSTHYQSIQNSTKTHKSYNNNSDDNYNLRRLSSTVFLPTNLPQSNGGWYTPSTALAGNVRLNADIVMNNVTRPTLSKTGNVDVSESGDVLEDVPHSVPDLSIKDGNFRSIVHLAAMSRSTKILSEILSYTECEVLANSVDIKGNTPLHSIFSGITSQDKEEDVITCIDMLINYGVDMNTVNVSGETLVYAATKKKRPDALLHLLNNGGDPCISTTLNNWSPVHVACHADCSMCLEHLFNTGLVAHQIKQETSNCNVPFVLGTCSYSLSCLKVLLKNGDHLTNEDSNGKSRCAHLLENIPNAGMFLEELFDENITGCVKRPHEAEFTISFDYTMLLSQKYQEVQCSLISELTTRPLENLFTHPLIETFLFIKWNRIKPFFYTNFVVYFLFLMLHTYYVLRTFSHNASDWSNALVMLNIFRMFHIIVFLLILIPDMIIMLANIRKYLLQWETYVKIITLSTSAFIVFSQHVETPGDMMVEKHVAAVSIFFSWVELMMLLGRFPILGVYILMFTKVAKSIIKFLFAFSSLLIGFAIAFGIIFSNIPEFQSFPASLVKTLMMMIGEIDYAALVQENGTQMPVLGYISLVAFLFLVPILMANLLIGLAVSDLPDLSRQGKIKRLSKQASYLQAYELLILFFKELRCFPHIARIVLANRAKIKSKLTIYPNKRHHARKNRCRKWIETLPLETIEMATQILIKRRETSFQNTNSDEEEEDRTASISSLKKIRKNSRIRSRDIYGRSHSTISKNSNISNGNTSTSFIQHQIREAYESFEKEYKREFNSLRQYIRNNIVYNHHRHQTMITIARNEQENAANSRKTDNTQKRNTVCKTKHNVCIKVSKMVSKKKDMSKDKNLNSFENSSIDVEGVNFEKIALFDREHKNWKSESNINDTKKINSISSNNEGHRNTTTTDTIPTSELISITGDDHTDTTATTTPTTNTAAATAAATEDTAESVTTADLVRLVAALETKVSIQTNLIRRLIDDKRM